MLLFLNLTNFSSKQAMYQLCICILSNFIVIFLKSILLNNLLFYNYIISIGSQISNSIERNIRFRSKNSCFHFWEANNSCDDSYYSCNRVERVKFTSTVENYCRSDIHWQILSEISITWLPSWRDAFYNSGNGIGRIV